MQILEYLLSFFLKNNNFGFLKPILELLQKNSFDLSATLKNLNLEAVAPIIQAFISNFNSPQNKKEAPTDFSVGETYGITPIANLADKQIVYTLNKYFCNA